MGRAPPPQIGKLLGAKVIAVARGRDKTAMLGQLGADLVVDSGVVSKPLKHRIKSVAPQGAALNQHCGTATMVISGA